MTKGRFDTPSHFVFYLVASIMTQAINPELLKTPWHFKVKKYTGYAIGWLVDRLPFTAKSYVIEYFEMKQWAQRDNWLGPKLYNEWHNTWLNNDDYSSKGCIYLGIEIRHKHNINVPKAELDAILNEAKAKIKALEIQ